MGTNKFLERPLFIHTRSDCSILRRSGKEWNCSRGQMNTSAGNQWQLRRDLRIVDGVQSDCRGLLQIVVVVVVFLFISRSAIENVFV